MTTCESCSQTLESQLGSIPSEWRKQIARVICKNIVGADASINCEDVKACESLTSLSAFYESNGEICIKYKDEKGVTVTRCFDPTVFQTALANGDYGDITVSGAGDVWTIDPDTVTFGKMQNINTQRLLGRYSPGSGDVQEITLGLGLNLDGAGELSVNNAPRFGVSGEDDTAGEDREFDQGATYNFLFKDAQLRVTGEYTLATTGLGPLIEPYDEAQMFFNPRKGAFRAGQGTSGGWWEANVGGFSASFGANNVSSGGYSMSWGTANEASAVMSTAWGADSLASGSRSTAWGDGTIASGYNTTAFGQDTVASGHFATSLGIGTTSKSHAGLVIGTYNDDTAPALENDFAMGNRLFQIGIGWDGTSRENALTVLQSGHAGFGVLVPTALIHIKGSTTAAGTAPIKLEAGTVMTVAEDGAVEFDGTDYFVSVGTTRYTLAKTLTDTAALDFGLVAAQTSADLTIALTGAVVGDAVVLGSPVPVANTAYTAFVSAPDVVTVRLHNYGAAGVNPVSGTFRVSILKY